MPEKSPEHPPGVPARRSGRPATTAAPDECSPRSAPEPVLSMAMAAVEPVRSAGR
jgi:hypothetical protein